MTVLPRDVCSAMPASDVGKEGYSVVASRSGAAAARPIGGPEPDWMDRFMEAIMGRKYDAAREVLRSAVAQGAGNNLAEQYGKVLEDMLQQAAEIENPSVRKEVATFGVVSLREMDNHTGRGLIVPGYVNWGDELWRQRPVAYIQSPSSRAATQVCDACLVPVGTLASQLVFLGQPVPEGAEEVEVVNGACSPVQCPGGCSEVFCGEACCEWAQTSSSHALLCKGSLPATALVALEDLEKLAEKTDQEHLLLLAHHIAVILLRRLAGDALSDVMQHFVKQFFSSPWETLTSEEDADGDTPSYREDLLGQAAGHLRRLFADQELAEPFLDIEILSSMMGTYEQVNMCISISHPLNTQCDRTSELLQPVALAKLHRFQKGVDQDSDEEDDEAEAGDKQDRPQPVAEPTEDDIATALQTIAKQSLFANVVGTSLCEALSFTNHSCLPNARIDFATSATPDNNSGPGLWVFSAARRPMLPGDEVQMCYVPSVVGKPVKERQKRMKKFGFECRCRCCTTDLMLEADE